MNLVPVRQFVRKWTRSILHAQCVVQFCTLLCNCTMLEKWPLPSQECIIIPFLHRCKHTETNMHTSPPCLWRTLSLSVSVSLFFFLYPQSPSPPLPLRLPLLCTHSQVTYLHSHTRRFRHTHTHTHMRAPARTHTHTCARACTHRHTYMYIHTQVHNIYTIVYT